MEEAYTTEHWLVRIYRVKDLSNRQKLRHVNKPVKRIKRKSSRKVSQSVCALSPVNRKGLNQDWKRASGYLLQLFIPQVIILQVSFSQTTTQIMSAISEHDSRKTQFQKNNNTCFGDLFILCGHSTQEPASIVWNSEQGDLLYSAGPRRN